MIERMVREGWIYIKKGLNPESLREDHQSAVMEQTFKSQQAQTTEPAMAHSVAEDPIDNNASNYQTELDVGLLADYDPVLDPQNQYEVPEWPKSLERAFIEGAGKAMCVNTAFITRYTDLLDSDDSLFRVFTSNNVYIPIVNLNRQITEVYLKYPAWGGCYSEEDVNSTRLDLQTLKIKNTNRRPSIKNVPYRIQGFLTQYADVDERPPALHLFTENIQNDLKNKENISRDAVVIQPLPSIYSPYGDVYLYPETHTANEKIFLHQYEFATLHKGGVYKFLAIPEGVDTTIKDSMISEMKRGINSRGQVLITPGGTPVAENVYLSESSIPDLHFDIINSHISEASKLTKQAVEGQASTGALGGQAPIINRDEDMDTRKDIKNWVEETIKHINYVFYGVDPNEYDIFFYTSHDPFAKARNNPQKNTDPINFPDQAQDSEASNSFEIGKEIEVFENSVSDTYITFVGNMFQAGPYLYPEPKYKEKVRIFTPQDIELFTKRDVRSGYLELDHSFDDITVAGMEGVGYWETQGYDSVNKSDITKFHVRKAIYQKLGSPKTIKVSPWFSIYNPSSGPRQLIVKNCAITLNTRPRSELSGLKTEAERQ